MEEIIKNDIISILNKSLKAIKHRDMVSLTDVSNEINHNSSIYQDEDSITIAILIYALAKIYYRENIIKNSYVTKLKQGLYYLRQNRFDRYRQTIKSLVNQIKKEDEKLNYYITDLLDKAGLKKGTKLIYNGISVSRVAELMGISQWELINYIGKTNIMETFDKTPKVMQRLKYARSLFR